MLLEPSVSRETTKRFEWKDSEGRLHPVDSMATRHLFHTLRMIWNHFMPEDARSTEYKRYYFGSFYTRDYLAAAIRAMFPLLMARPDLEWAWQTEIERWRLYLERHPFWEQETIYEERKLLR